MRNPNSRIPLVNDFVTPAGNRKKELFTPKFDGQRVSLVSSGFIDVQEKIDAYAPFCDISYMLSRLKVGDSSVINSAEPMYGDFTTIPRNPIDAINLVHDAERAFASLPDDIRSSCNNDWRVFFAKSIDGTLYNTSGDVDNSDSPNLSGKLLNPDVDKPIVSRDIHESNVVED